LERLEACSPQYPKVDPQAVQRGRLRPGIEKPHAQRIPPQTA
jgi:hypothetical protein